MGLTDPPKFGGHALRSLYISKLANNPSVSTKECIFAACHNSVSAQVPYIQSTGATEKNKLHALGFSVPGAAHVPPK